MKRVVIAVLILILLAIGAIFLNKDKVGDIRPAILPPARNSSIPLENANNLKVNGNFKIEVYVKDIGQARDLEFSPGGTLLVSTPVQGKVLALVEENEKVIVKDVVNGLTYPHGIAFYKGKLFIAEETRLVRYNYDEKSYKATEDKVLFNIPVGGNHVSRSIAFRNNGDLILSMGSRCNVCFEKDPWIAATVISNPNGDNPRLFATGLRNAVFLKVNPETQAVWSVEMGRDFLGDDLPPDEIDVLKEGKNYGWPVCYGDRVYDSNFGQKNPEFCKSTVAPAFKIQAHSAPLGLNFIHSSQFPTDWQGDLLVSYHGSWNRSIPTGYKVVHLKVNGEKVVSQEDFITGFISGSQAVARPVDLEFDKSGNLYLSDDKAGVVYKVSKL